MKKIKFFIILMSMVVIIGMMPIYAAGSTEILKGTPVIDGVVDDIYLQSFSFDMNTTDNQVYAAGAEYTDLPDFKATTYLLWDDQFIYICTVVNDGSVMSRGQDVITTNGEYTWDNDVVEMWFSFDDCTTWSQFNLDAFGLQVGMSPSFNLNRDDGYTGKAKIDGGSYVIEAVLPNTIKAGDTFNYNSQVNNILVEDASQLVCIGAQKDPREIKLSATEVIKPEVIEEAPATEEVTPEVAETVTTDTAAQTSDVASISAVMVMGAAALAFFNLKKKVR